MNAPLTDPGADARIAAVEDNLLAFFVHAAQQEIVTPIEADDVGGYWSDIAFPLLNAIADARFAEGRERERAEAVLAEYRERGLPFLWWVTPSTTSPALEETLLEAGMHREDVPGMYVELSAPLSKPVPDGIDVQVVASESQDMLVTTMLAGFGMPAELSVPMGALFSSFPPEQVVNVLAVVDGVPAGVGTAFLTGETAGLYNIATLEAFRGRGIGYAVTARLMDEAHDRGCTEAILHASPMGRPVYERLGFEEVCTVPQFVWLPEA